MDMSSRRPEEVFSVEPHEVKQMQITGVRQRYAELRSKIRVVDRLADDLDVTEIGQLDDIVPLCLPHTVYKSYSVRDVEKGRFDRLTEWLDGLTTENLSGVDVDACESLETWLDTIEAATELRPLVSSGTTGKVSFFPRSNVEAAVFLRYMVQALAGFRGEPDSGLAGGEPDWFSALPMATGRQTIPRMLDLIRRHCYGGDFSRIHSLGRGHWDADMLWLWGRIRAAEAKGESLDAKLTPNLERVRDAVRQSQALAAENSEQFLRELVEVHRGGRVILFGPTGMLIQLAAKCKERGLEPNLDVESFIVTGGGTKGHDFPDGWESLLHSVFPLPHQEIYGMTESTGTCRLCSAGWFHWPPTVVTFVLDPDTSEPMPRTGVRTGRFAIFDLCAETHWGGAITGDQVTIDWDGNCSCGRQGPRVMNNVTRYSSMRNDDKITCAKSPGAYERAVDYLAGMS
jgi:hypothetical protein